MQITNLAGIARVHGAKQPDAPAIVHRGGTLTYGELDRRSNRVASALVAAGVGRDDRVAFLDRSGPEYFEAVLGTAKTGAVLCPVNWRLAPDEAAFVIADTDARVLVVGEELLDTYDAIADRLPSVEHVVLVGGAREGLEGYEDWLARHDEVDPGVDTGADDVVLQFYSSGTTGVPKGVMLTNGNFMAGIAANNESLRFGPGSVSLVAMPLFHVAGGLWGIIGLYNGCPNVLARDVDPAWVVQTVAEHRITHTVLVPAVIQFMLMVPGVDEADFTSLEVLVYGASPISEEVLTGAIRTFGCDFLQAYGMTETTGGCVLLPPEDHDPTGPNRHRLRAAGKAAPNTELRVVDESMHDVPNGTVGEIVVRGPQNMKGYWKRPDATAETITDDGWLRTGDAGWLDDDGYVYIHDRVKDMIISGGENIYPAEVENALMSHPSIADVAVIGVPDDRWGETPKAVVVAAPGASPTPEEIIGFAREKLAHYKCPTSVDFVDALPRNPSGKILKRELRAPYWAGRDRMVR